MLYNDDPWLDNLNILAHINRTTKELGLKDVHVDTGELWAVCVGMRQQFPYVGGMSKASPFKKVANFVAYFLQLKPIKTRFALTKCAGGDDINAVIALDVAVACLEMAEIEQSGGGVKKIDHPIYISDHSYIDIIEALSTAEIEPKSHYHILAVFFEQMVYKTNNHCEYPPATNGVGYYPTPGPVAQTW